LDGLIIQIECWLDQYLLLPQKNYTIKQIENLQINYITIMIERKE
jgi:hypothetical protein